MANPFWLSNHLDLHHCYLVVPPEPGEETCALHRAHQPCPERARGQRRADRRVGRYDPAAAVARRLRELRRHEGSAGLVGVNATFSMGMPYPHHARLRDDLPGP